MDGEDLKSITVSALKKRATGYETVETVEEYAFCEGEETLVKKRVTKKSVPPDVAAARALFELGGEEIKSMTDEELESEKIRLLALLGSLKEKDNDSSDKDDN